MHRFSGVRSPPKTPAVFSWNWDRLCPVDILLVRFFVAITDSDWFSGLTSGPKKPIANISELHGTARGQKAVLLGLTRFWLRHKMHVDVLSFPHRSDYR